MNRNQKIAIGCGAVGCLGLIVVVIAAGILFYLRSQTGRISVRERSNRNFNFNTNSSSNDNSETANSAEESASSYSDDEKHKLFQAAGMTQDSELIQKVFKKIGLFKADGTPAPGYEGFVKDHISWATNNAGFITSISSPEKARAYVDAHLQD